tara:strand:- start:44 stop:646 length:603 start_codon:yes stop_codon:yes gene_type:complete
VSTIKNVAVFFVIVLILLVSAGVWYAWQVGPGCLLVGVSPFASVQYTFSEFEEINGTGIYVSEVLEMDQEEVNECFDNKVSLSVLWVELIDNEGVTNFIELSKRLQDNYAGNIEENVNLAKKVANDNGTEFPIHFENQMDNDFEKYGDGEPFGDSLYLSIGDKIKVYGSGSEANGPAENGWSLQIRSGTYIMPNTDLVIP